MALVLGVALLALPPAGRSPRPVLTRFDLPSVSHSPASPPADFPVLFVGGSITSGLLQTSFDATYPARVIAGLRAQGLAVTWQERAKSGATVGDALTWPYPADQRLVVVQVITNDFVLGTPVELYRSRLRLLLGRLRAASPQAALTCLGTWQRDGVRNLGGQTPAAYDVAARSECAARRGRFVPLDTIFMTPGARGPAGAPTPWGPADGFHPNDAGAQLIADAILDSLDPAGDQPPPAPWSGGGNLGGRRGLAPG